MPPVQPWGEICCSASLIENPIIIIWGWKTYYFIIIETEWSVPLSLSLKHNLSRRLLLRCIVDVEFFPLLSFECFLLLSFPLLVLAMGTVRNCCCCWYCFSWSSWVRRPDNTASVCREISASTLAISDRTVFTWRISRDLVSRLARICWMDDTVLTHLFDKLSHSTPKNLKV